VRLDFVGVGAARCGTTWLAKCLGAHPAIFLPERKELHFFNDDRKYEPGLAWLRPHLAGAAPEQVVGEFTPRYLISRTALERLRRHFPEARPLVLLRDPVERAISQYRYFRFVKRKEPERDLLVALDGVYHEDYVVKGRYAGQLETLFELFPRERVWVGLYDDIAAGSARLIAEVYAFLGVDPSFRPPLLDRVVNAAPTTRGDAPRAWSLFVRWLTRTPVGLVGRRRGRLLSWAEGGNRFWDRHGRAIRFQDPPAEVLDEIYRSRFAADVEATERLLGRDLSAWKRGRPEPVAATR